MGLLEELKTLGVDVEEGLERMMGKTSLYERMLGSFVKMMSESFVEPDFDFGNYGEIIEKAHVLKGATGNLSITPLYEAYSEIVRLLREEQPEQANEILKNVLPVQEEILSCIKRYI